MADTRLYVPLFHFRSVLLFLSIHFTWLDELIRWIDRSPIPGRAPPLLRAGVQNDSAGYREERGTDLRARG
jgi:hypothetical protein